MEALRVLIVDGEREIADGVERSLRKELPRSSRIVRARRAPARVDAFDIAIVVAGAGAELPVRIPKLPTVIVGPRACAGDSAALARRGVEHGLSPACATCVHEPILASSLEWTMQRERRLRALERAQARERRNALHDGLTGLPNMRLCRDRLRHLLAQARRKDKHVAVLYVDLDRFKEMNDRYGHAAGDRLLRDVAARLGARTRETDTVARRGGDEFVILLDDVRGRSEAEGVAREILACISKPTCIGGTVVRASASIGVAVFPEDGRNGKSLERQADFAMYAAKRAGGNKVALADGSRLAPTSSRGRHANACSAGRPALHGSVAMPRRAIAKRLQRRCSRSSCSPAAADKT